MEPSPRRLELYASPQAYLNSLSPGGQKILIIGAGLAYDDLVIDSENRFIGETEVEKTRPKYYPRNAYLIDFDGKFFYKQTLPSSADLQADIQKGIGEDVGDLPNVFENQFDYIVLENLDFNSLSGNAFKNIYRLLKVGGKIVSNAHYEINLLDTEAAAAIRGERIESAILDDHHNALIELYYSFDWAGDEESLLEEFSYGVSPAPDVEDVVYQALAKTHEGPAVNIISFEAFEKRYNADLHYRSLLSRYVQETYAENLTQYFNKLLPTATFEFSPHAEDVWSAPLVNTAILALLKRPKKK